MIKPPLVIVSYGAEGIFPFRIKSIYIFFCKKSKLFAHFCYKNSIQTRIMPKLHRFPQSGRQDFQLFLPVLGHRAAGNLDSLLQ